MEQQPTQSQNRRRPLVIIGVAIGALIAVCLCIAVLSSPAPNNDQETAEAPATAQTTEKIQEAAVDDSLLSTDVAEATGRAEPTAPVEPTSTLVPTATPEPTATTFPTDTPLPTDTPIPIPSPVLPTDTPTVAPPTETPLPRPTNTVRPTATPSTPALVPGLWPADVTENMKTRGFECTGVQESQDYFIWSCTRSSEVAMLRVDVYGRTLTSIDMIEAASLQFGLPDDALSTEFLGFVSTMPYDGANPDAARAWVRETIPTLQGEGDARSATFGGVEYRLLGIPTARTLEIGTLR